MAAPTLASGVGRMLRLSDDIGTVCTHVGGMGGDERQFSFSLRFAPGIPDAAKRLTVAMGKAAADLIVTAYTVATSLGCCPD